MSSTLRYCLVDLHTSYCVKLLPNNLHDLLSPFLGFAHHCADGAAELTVLCAHNYVYRVRFDVYARMRTYGCMCAV